MCTVSLTGFYHSLSFNFRVILITFFILSKIIIAQEVLVPEWLIDRISPISNEESQAWGIDVDNTGNVYWSTDQVFPGEGFNIVFYKLDADSNEVWPSPTLYGGIYRQVSHVVKVAGDRVYVGGITDHGTWLNSADMLILAVDIFSGDTLWSTIWDQGYGYEEVDDILLADDGIYVTGWTTGDNVDFDVALLKLDYNGNILLTNTWGTEAHDHQDGHAVMDDSVIYVAGLYESPNGLQDGESLLAKFSLDSLTYLDHITFGGTGPWPNQENAQGMTSDGTNLYLVGVTTVSLNNVDVFVAKYDKNLNQLWYKLWGGAGQESARGITIANNGTIYVAGNTASYGTGIDVALLNYAADGSFLGFHTWGGAEEDGTQDIKAKGNFLYITGRSKSLHPFNTWAAYLMKVNIDSVTTSIHSSPVISNFHLGQNYPNPFNSQTTIRFQLPVASIVTIKLLDILGREIKILLNAKEQPGRHEIQVDGNGLSSGIYFYQLRTGQHVEIKKMLLIQ